MAQSRHVLIKLIGGDLMLTTVFICNPHSAVLFDSDNNSPCTFEGDLLIYF